MLWFNKHAQCNLQQTPVTSTCTACGPFSHSLSLSLFLSFSLSSPHFFISPLSLFASAPPYNHASSWLSFGVVYIAVIVRVQYRDWAEHVYSLTGMFCSKSHSGRDWREWGLCTCAGTCTHKATLIYTQCSNNSLYTHREIDTILQPPKKMHCTKLQVFCSVL